MAVNNFLQFCPTNTGSNLLTQGAYAVATDRDVGNQPGIANPELVNKALRQSAGITSVFAQFMSDHLNVDVLDDGDYATLYNQVAALFASILPTGMVLPFAGAAAPDYFLLCYGQAISRSTYADLFSAIGTTFGVGNGTTTFNLPDLRGRAVAGKDNMGGSTAGRVTAANSGITGTTLGDAGGFESIVLDTTMIPSHTHTQNSHTHTQDAHTHTQNSHTHTQNSHNHTQDSHDHLQDAHSHLLIGNGANIQSTQVALSGSSGLFVPANPGSINNYGPTSNTTATNQAATATNQASTAVNQSTTATNQTTTATNQATTAVNQNTGGGLLHNNMQPTMILNYIIKI